MATETEADYWTENDIAIVGMAAHLPGSATLEDYWTNLRDGVECITPLSEEALLEAGESPSRLRHKNYVRAAAILEDFEKFDAEFFGLSPKEAAIMDPQHRQFLEVSWEALEIAGHMPERFEGDIGVFGGCGMGSYFYFNVCSNPELVDSTGMFLLRHTGNDKDFLSTRLSHILDLKGPSLSVQTACSTSLVAAHYACQALLNGECDMALAGGVTIELPHKRGYIFEEGEILSPDGHCHAFDHRAQGTVFGSGAGVVVLRRMADALADGDHIWGVIRGSAVNNDGSAKAGYLAPSVDGQAAAIADAQAMADVTADTIDYVECHGTGTYLGDPIEVAALTEAFRETTDARGYCRIGSVKTNIGHLDTAAGAASLIKTALSLHHKQMPPSLGFEAPNPAIDFESSPFEVNAALQPWESHKGPRRAGVNSLGVGGTNAHVIVQEAPQRPASEPSDWPYHLLTISGRNAKALDANCAALAAHLRAHPDQDLADVAYTLQKGRRAFEKRRIVVARDHAEAATLLDEKTERRVFTHTADHADPEVVFMFPGGGAQYARMAQDLYETEPVFQDWMDRGLDILQAKVSHDVRALWLAEGMDLTAADEQLKQPSLQLPLIMIVEYALAQLWMSWGVTPAVLMGHSMGENTAACLAGVMSFEDCIGLVLLRGQLFDTVPAGGMLSVPLALDALHPYLDDDLDIAAENAADLTVVSGPDATLQALAERLAADEIEAQRIAIDIAAHSRMLEPILAKFEAYLRQITLSAPNLPIMSNRSGQLLSDAEAMDPMYWVGHLRGTVRFAACVETCAAKPGRIFLEVGPGKALNSLARMNRQVGAGRTLSSLRHPQEEIEDDLYFMQVLGQLWACGAGFDWAQIWGEARRNRVILPTYQFQRSSYFIAPGSHASTATEALLRQENMADWGYRSAWMPRAAECDVDLAEDLTLAVPHTWLIFLDDAGLGTALTGKLRAAGQTVITVAAGDAYDRVSEDHYLLAPERGREGYDQLLADLIALGRAPDRIVHLWLLTASASHRPGSSFFHRNLEQGFYSLMFLGQAMVSENLARPIQLTAVTNGAAQLRQEGLPQPEKATIRGPLGVMPREVPGLSCKSIDVDELDVGALLPLLTEDLMAPPETAQVAYRGARRFVKTSKPLPLPAQAALEWQAGATYLITGGFGGIGVTVARDMLQAGANVVLQTRRALPARSEWDSILEFTGSTDRRARQIAIVRELEALPGNLKIVVADVNNINDMRAAKEDILAQFGAITGVIHAAGVINDAPMLSKSSADVEDVLAPKLHGTLVLDQLFADGALDWLVLFASTSTVITPAGQVDYVAANEFLNAYAQSRAGDQTKVLAVNWGVWSDVGMAAEAIAADTSAKPTKRRPVEAPTLSDVAIDADGTLTFEATLDADTTWMLDQHRSLLGEAIMPGTGYLSLISEAMQVLDGARAYAVRDLTFLRALHVTEGATRALRLRLTPTDAGYDLAVLADYRDGFVVHAEGRIAMSAMPQPTGFDLAAVRARCDQDVAQAKPGETLRSPQEAHLRFGPHWQVVTQTALGAGEGLAELTLPDHLRQEAKGMALHPGLLDLGTGWAMQLIDGYQAGNLWVPVRYDALRHYGALPAQIVSWVRLVDGTSGSGTARFDVVLADKNGSVCVEVQGLTLRRLAGGFALNAMPAPKASEILRDGAAQQVQPLSANEQRLQQTVAEGIPAQLGGEALRRAMGQMGQRGQGAKGLSQVIVSSLDLAGLSAQLDALGADDPAQNQGFERPDLDSEFVAPANDIERTLAQFWQELLGIDEVGTQDSFFDLGGHSLVAVRLFSMVKKTYQIDFPISVLFEAPTIAQCAALIAERIGPAAASESPQPAETAKAEVPERRYTHIVPMQVAADSEKTPFFLVAGMYGNVLNLRHLAHLIGADRPIYGLQARGLFGDAAPHDDLAEAARDYLAELRQVQPKGPYLLGGFSGGGITAYEMAQQLTEMGEEVSLLVMLDTPLPLRRPLSREDRIAIQMQELKAGGPGYLARWIKNRVAWELQKRRRPEATDDTVGAQFHNAEIEAAFYRALPKYQLRPWQGRVALFRPPLVGKWQVGPDRWVNSERTYVLPDNDWGQYVSDLVVSEVPGDHDSMVLEPNVRVLAAQIQKEIERAEARHQVVVPFRPAAE
ncbi:beta-ketoacyl synthase N-terminal-like domain-containing protein [Cognatishimia sp. SS12]|uniref:type I polyketide synthase n=1 Tax=Cognatishimia sp. SS12 TaxID=2979465 RepID=UPI00232D0552|nr:type I polyketide synthase [Cognatishimia sp. SS12]MDC0736818.1 beta-ketoacyl synthase N-terminal-like domain-containing protein [Cognatishimia sp. SS12]